MRSFKSLAAVVDCIVISWVGCAPALLAAEPAAGKKLIEWGWDEPDTRQMRQNIKQMEEMPFDGLVFHALTTKRENFTWLGWSARRFEQAEVQHAIDDLRATPFKRFTERFLRVNVCPGSVDWFDDAGWNSIQHNMALAASIAKQGNCRGFMFDVEQYEGQLFDYRRQTHRATKSFAEYRAVVRQRGRQWMQAVGAEYPEIVILLTFGYAVAQPRDKAAERSEIPYALLADFLDGMLEACPPQAKIVDAWEQAYPYKQAEQFRAAYDTIQLKGPVFSAVPDRYRRHVQAGFGIWMDYDWRKHGWSTEDFSKNHFTPATLETSLRAALAASDQYVWLYTEQPRWWTNERLPKEYVEAVRRARK